MRVENSVVFMCHVARVVVVRGLSDVQMKVKRRGEGHCPLQGDADDHGHYRPQHLSILRSRRSGVKPECS
jgi:hypothetical protein